MQTATADYKLIKKIKDAKFDEDKLHQYVLLIQLGIRDFQVAVLDEENSHLLFFEDYVLGDLSSHEELLTLIQTLFESHELLTAGFWKQVKVSIKNNKVVQVPASLFIESAQEEYLRFNAQFSPETEIVLFCRNNSTDAISVFAFQRLMYEWLNSLYINTTVTYLHQSACLIEGVFKYATGNPVQPLFIYVDRFKLHIISLKAQKLIYYNQFAIKQFSDYMKYIMLVLKALNMDQQTSKVVLWGYIGKNSPHYNEFYKYIRNVTFGDRPAHLRFGYMFDDIQDHHFFDLYSMNLLGKA